VVEGFNFANAASHASAVSLASHGGLALDRTKLLDARLRYDSAYLAYKACATRMSGKTRRDEMPTAEDLKAEADALAFLDVTRKVLLGVLAG
jgi:hypothetical protein